MKVHQPKQAISVGQEVGSSSGVGVVGVVGSTEAAARPTGPGPGDRVTTDEANRLRETVATAKNMAAGERALRLQSLAREVGAGTYRPNVSRLAAEIVARAELDARLAQSLG